MIPLPKILLKGIFLFIFSCITTHSVFSQGFIDILGSETSISRTNNGMSIWEEKINQTLPITLKEKTFLSPSVTYQSEFYKKGDDQLQINGHHVELGFLKITKKDWWITAKAELYNYRKHGERRSKQNMYFATLFASKQVNKQLYIGGGLFHRYTFGTHFTFPIIDFEYKWADKWTLRAIVPRYLRFFRHFGKDKRLGIEVNAKGNPISISANDIFLNQNPINFPWTYVRSFVFYDVYFAKNTALNIATGLDFMRQHRLYNTQNQEIVSNNPLFGDYPNLPFVRVGVYYRFRYD
jgi:hypothetical protein